MPHTKSQSVIDRFKIVVGIAAGLLSAGFGGAMYLNRYATAADLNRLEARVISLYEKLELVGAINERTIKLDTDIQDIKEKLDQIPKGKK